MKNAKEWWQKIIEIKLNYIPGDLLDSFEATLPAIRDEQRQGTRMALRDTMQRIIDNHPLSCEFETDARYIWPKRWAALEAAIPNAGKAPALKPGMLVVDKRNASHPFVYTEQAAHAETLRPYTRAEIMALHDKAPE